MSRRRIARLSTPGGIVDVPIVGDWPTLLLDGWIYIFGLNTGFAPNVRVQGGRHGVERLDYPVRHRLTCVEACELLNNEEGQMAHGKARAKVRHVHTSVADRVMRLERALLERGVRHQRRLRRLAGELRRATAAADAALRNVGHMVLMRETPVEREPGIVERMTNDGRVGTGAGRER